jgi:hypothetical protein
VLLGLARSTLYYRLVPIRHSMLRIMARIDAFNLENPCSGTRLIIAYFARQGIAICHDRVRIFTCRMSILAFHQKPFPTIPGNSSLRFPGLPDFSEITMLIKPGSPISPTFCC